MSTENILNELLQERTKQVNRWGNALDDTWVKGELVDGAICYLMNNVDGWPSGDAWNPANFKSCPDKTNRRGQLIRAATMIVAEIERLDRADVKASKILS